MTETIFAPTGLWTRAQTVLALYWYLQIPFGQIHSRNPKLIEWAAILGRTPGALSFKMVNMASLDPLITDTGRSGMKNCAKLDHEVWDHYKGRFDQLNQDAQALLTEAGKNLLDQLALQAESSSVTLPDEAAEVLAPTQSEAFAGETQPVWVQRRLRQGFFRGMVLSNFEQKCALSGLAQPSLLVASHIVGWAQRAQDRLNPHNGLALSALYDRAFDQHWLSFDEDFRVLLSPQLKKTAEQAPYDCGLLAVEGRTLQAPKRFAIDPQLMAEHRARYLQKCSGKI